MYARSLGVLIRACPRSINTPTPLRVRFYATGHQPLSEELKESRRTATEASLGIPEAAYKGTVRIVRETRHAMQSAAGRKFWTIVWPEISGQWEERVMGWTSSANPMKIIKLKFNTAEDAVEWCEAHAFQYEIEELEPEKQRLKSYGDRFKYKPLPKDDPIC